MIVVIILAVLTGILGGLTLGAYLWIGELPDDKCEKCEFWEEGKCSELEINTHGDFNCMYYIDKNTGVVYKEEK